MKGCRVRLRFAKTGDLKLVSHRDLVRAFERMFRRARVELAMSQGFHPRPLMTFPDALALGIEGLDEVMDLTLTEDVEPAAFHALLSAACPPGLQIKQVLRLDEGTRKVKIKKSVYAVTLPPDIAADTLQPAIDDFAHRDTLTVERKDKQVELNLKETLDRLWLDDGKLYMSLRVAQQSQLQPRDILATLGLRQALREGVTITRTKIEIAR